MFSDRIAQNWKKQCQLFKEGWTEARRSPQASEKMLDVVADRVGGAIVGSVLVTTALVGFSALKKAAMKADVVPNDSARGR